jgi:hypothetical protein
LSAQARVVPARQPAPAVHQLLAAAADDHDHAPPCASLPPAQQLARFCAGDLTCHPLVHPEACLTFCRTLPPAEACAYSSCAGLVPDCSASPSGAFIEAR